MLCKSLVRLQLRRLCAGAESFYTCRFEHINYAPGQRVFRPDNSKTDIIAPGKIDQFLNIVGTNIDVRPALSRPRITWRDIKPPKPL